MVKREIIKLRKKEKDAFPPRGEGEKKHLSFVQFMVSDF
jgi:hypothetical protein